MAKELAAKERRDAKGAKELAKELVAKEKREKRGKKVTTTRKKKSTVKSQKNHDVAEDMCKFCDKKYGDPEDPLRDEEWVSCQKCSVWLHESCAEKYGVFDDDEDYLCQLCIE